MEGKKKTPPKKTPKNPWNQNNNNKNHHNKKKVAPITFLINTENMLTM